jgi:isopenicillin N synthase-like dioxygenase
MANTTIPIIDLQSFLSNNPAEKALVAAQIHEACKSFGVFYLINHGIDESNILQNMKAFFNLSSEEKNAIKISKKGIARGYIGMGEESGSDALEVKEAFSYGCKWPSDKPLQNTLQGINLWPALNNLPIGWNTSMEDFYSKMIDVAETLTRAFSLSYANDENYLGNYCIGGDTISMMRLFHYFPYHKANENFPDQQNRIGSSAHTDWGFLTLILQEHHVTGLELFHNNEWIEVPSMEGALTVNCGDYFSMLTNGEYISPLHRVVSSGKERMSAVLFYYPAYDAKIPTLAKQKYSLFENQDVSQEAVTDISTMSFGEFIEEKWKQVRR